MNRATVLKKMLSFLIVLVVLSPNIVLRIPGVEVEGSTSGPVRFAKCDKLV